MDRIGPGTLLAGRYRLEEQVQADDVTALWRAEDLTLERSVGVRVLSASHPRVQSTLDAARRAALVDDPRLQRVLGVGTEAGSGYVVMEWVAGEDAGSLAGDVDEVEALRLVTGAAEALRIAAARQLHHGRIGPRQLVRAPDGRVRVLGTAVEVAASGQPTPAAAARPESRDVRDLAAVLYLLLSGRWPFGAVEGLPAAPTDKGRPVPVRTLRTEVSPGLDELLARTVAGSGPDTLDELVQRLDAVRTELEGPTAPAGRDGGDEDGDDTDVLMPVTGAGAAGAARSGADTPGAGTSAAGAGAVAAGSAAAGSAAGPPTAYPALPGDLTPAPVGPWTVPEDDDGWDLLPVGDDQWDDSAWDDGSRWSQEQQPWDDEPRDDRAGGGATGGATAGTATGGAAAGGAAAGGATAVGAAAAGPAATGAAAAPVLVPRGGGAARRRPAGAGTGVAVVLVMGAFVVGGLVWALDGVRDAEPVAAPTPSVVEASEPSPEPSQPPPAEPPPEPVPDEPQLITPVGVQALDPQGDGEENDQDAPRAIDGDPATAWTTQRYNSQDFGGLKTGLGVALDLGEPREVVSVQVQAPGDGGSYEVRTADGPSFDGSTTLLTGQTGPEVSELAPETPVTTQHLIVWFTSLPQNDGDWRAALSEVQVQVR